MDIQTAYGDWPEPAGRADPAGQSGPSGQPDPAAQPGPADRPERRHWWSIRPAPPAPRISAKRAYAEVFVVFGGFFAASILAGAEALDHRYPRPAGSWAIFTPLAVSQLGMAALAIVVAVSLSGARGITPGSLGLRLPKRQDGRLALGSSLRTGVWALFALVAGTAVTASLTSARFGQPVRPDASYYLLYGTTASIGAGVIEEVVVLAFVVTTLRQANRPLPEIVAVAVLLRCSYHDYYGPGVVGIAVWATVFIWLFLRSGSVVPLIVVHFLWDASIFYAQNIHWRTVIGAIDLAALVLLPIVAGSTLLADMARRPGSGRLDVRRPGT
jgi:membrane protease YdiL (CAAX protease family)